MHSRHRARELFGQRGAEPQPQICRERTDLGLAFKQQSGRCPNDSEAEPPCYLVCYLYRPVAKFATVALPGPTALFFGATLGLLGFRILGFWCKGCVLGFLDMKLSPEIRNRAGIQIAPSGTTSRHRLHPACTAPCDGRRIRRFDDGSWANVFTPAPFRAAASKFSCPGHRGSNSMHFFQGLRAPELRLREGLDIQKAHFVAHTPTLAPCD